jgi:NAD/NADP transhydrogenase beta subunit
MLDISINYINNFIQMSHLVSAFIGGYFYGGSILAFIKYNQKQNITDNNFKNACFIIQTSQILLPTITIVNNLSTNNRESVITTTEMLSYWVVTNTGIITFICGLHICSNIYRVIKEKITKDVIKQLRDTI